MSKPWKVWLRGLIAAALGGMSTAAAGSIGALAGGIEVWTVKFWAVVGGTAILGALTHVFAYLQKSPIPEVVE